MTQILLLLASSAFSIYHLYTLAFKGKAAAEDLFPIAAAILFAIILLASTSIFIADRLSGRYDEKAADEDPESAVRKYLPELFGELGYIFFEYDCKADKIRFFERHEDRTGFPLVIENLLGSLENIQQIHPSDVYRLREFAGSSINEGNVRTIEIRLAMDGGEYRWHLIRAMKVATRQGPRIVGTANNIHEIKEERLRLIEKANTDSLTGLYTRDVIREKVNDFLFFRGENEVGTLFYMDVDNFKEMNDVLGHTMGDKVLVDFAQALRIACPTNAVICRMGGDEFAAFLPECSSIETAKKIGEYISDSIQRTYSIGVSSRILSISIGAALTCESDTDFSQVYDRADKALSNAKAKGKNCFEIYDFVEDTKAYETFPEWGIF